VGVGVGLLFAPAASRAAGVALESVAGTRGASTASVLTPVFEELARRGYRSGYEGIGRAFDGSVSRPSQNAGEVPSDLADKIDEAYRLWIGGKFAAGVRALQELIDVAHRNPAAVIANPKVGAALFKAEVGLAMCHHRLGNDTEAWAAMAELLRSYDLEVTKGQYGAEAFALYLDVKKEAKPTATGGLTVRSADPTAAIYVNERFAKIGEYSRADLLPGTYRVVAQLGPDYGRAYVVEVKAGSRVEVIVDPGFERTVVTSRTWTGLSFRDRADRDQREVEAAAKFGAAVGELGVVVVGIDTRKDRAVAYGALINASTGKEIRRASVVIDSLPPPERLRALARFLVGEPTSLDGVEVHKVVDRPKATAGVVAVAEAPRPVWSPRRKLAVGASALAVGAVAAGVVFTLQAKGFREDADKLCPTIGQACTESARAEVLSQKSNKRSQYAIASYAAGGALLVGAAVLWFTGAPSPDDDQAALVPQLGPGYAGLDLIGRF
jgi:hypothetical protein